MNPANPGMDLSALRRIAVFRALQLGDMLCVVPALRALRAAAPQARITLVGMPWADSFVNRFARYVDELLPFPGFPGFPEQVPDLAALPRFIERAQQCEFDLALQMHGSGRLSNSVTLLMGARHTAGYAESGAHPAPGQGFFLRWDEAEHEVLRYVRLLRWLGAAPQGDALEFPLMPTDWNGLERYGRLPARGSFVCIHPGARLASRRWFPERFAEVADRLAQAGLQVVLTGSDAERGIIDKVRGAMKAQALDLAGKTSLGELAALIAGARLVVCNDTGISHVAAAVATPSVIVCCGSDPSRWAPLDRERHALALASVNCRPCMHYACPTGHECAREVSSEAVAALAMGMLSRAPVATQFNLDG